MADQHDGLPPLLNVDNIADGAVYELMGEALKNLAINIMDPNTSEKATRSITLKVKVVPYPDRSGFQYEVAVETKFAGMKPATGTAYIAKKGGEYLVVGKNHRQLEMELDAAQVQTIEPDAKPKLV
jgi:hypothetical protein